MLASSSISNFNVKTKAYNFLVLGCVSFFVLSAVYLGFILQPLDGDLTRVGGLPEREYGWNRPQKRFPERLFSYYDPQQPLQEVDVIVLGDSFSNQKGRGFEWQNFFVARTGLRLVTYNLHEITLEDLLSQEAFKRKPPPIFIYQSAELSLDERLAAVEGDCSPSEPANGENLLVSKEQAYVLEPRSRELSFGANVAGRIDLAIHHIRLVMRSFAGLSKVAVFPMERKGLFSSKSQDLLVYSNRVPPKEGWPLDFERLGCGLVNLKRKVESELGSVFVPVLVPSKLSVYAQHVAHAPPSFYGYIDQIIETSQIRTPEVTEALRDLVTSGKVDVYLPNNSHWGYRGHQATADSIYRFMLEQHMITPTN